MQPEPGPPGVDRVGNPMRKRHAVRITHPMHAQFGKLGVVIGFGRQQGRLMVKLRVYVNELRGHIHVWASPRSVVVR